MKRKTTKKFKEEVFDLVGNEYKLLGEYVNAKTKIDIKHLECGYKYKVTPDSFLQGTRCPSCFGHTRKSTKQFKKEVKELVGYDYSVLGNYKNAHTKIKMKHNSCGHIYKVTPSQFLSNGIRCPDCFGNFKKTTEQFKKEIHKLYEGQFVVLGEYVNAKTKILVKHKCGHEYKVKPNNLLSGKGCPQCAIMVRKIRYSKSQEQFEKEVKKN